MNMPDIQTINEQQLHLYMPVCFNWLHPYTRPHRSESPHGDEGEVRRARIACDEHSGREALRCLACGVSRCHTAITTVLTAGRGARQAAVSHNSG